MSEANTPSTSGGMTGPEGGGGPISRPSGDGLPPKTGTGMHSPGAGDSADPGVDEVEVDIGPDAGGMIGEG